MKTRVHPTTKSLPARLLYLAVALAFGYAAIIKIADPAAFLSSILTFQLLPYRLAAVTALILPWLELMLAFCLAIGWLRRGAVWLTSSLLILFVALVVQARIRGLTVDCGCFGSNTISGDFEYAWKIGENVLMLLALWGAVIVSDVAAARSRRSRESL